jgi:glycosyltransferase involved in cell wall biosynthesis
MRTATLSLGPRPAVRRVRVLQVIARLNVGGPAYEVSLLAGGLACDRFEPLLVSGRVGNGEASFDELTSKYGAPHQIVRHLGPQLSASDDARALAELVGIVRRFRPDVVHTHTAKAGVLGRLAALHLGPRRPVLVHTYHGHVLRGYFGPAKTAVFRRVERRLARWTDCLIAVSPGVAADLVSLGVASSDRFRSIPLGLELDRFLELDDSAAGAFRQELRIPPEETLAVFVGRLAPIKRVDLLIRAVARARAAGVPLPLAIVGDGELRADLSRLAETSGAADAITFCGFRFDLPTIAADTDIAVLSSDNEGTPVALIEAVAAARPALSTDV